MIGYGRHLAPWDRVAVHTAGEEHEMSVEEFPTSERKLTGVKGIDGRDVLDTRGVELEGCMEDN